jgi:hypothetical protein
VTQNIYDDDTFFAGYSRNDRSLEGPTAEQIAARPALANERQRPPFLLVAARR